MSLITLPQTQEKRMDELILFIVQGPKVGSV